MKEQKNKSFLNFLVGYESPTDDARRSVGKKFYSKKMSGIVTQKTKRFLDSKPMRLLRGVNEMISYTPAKIYGILFLTFGLASLACQFAKDYFDFLGGSSISALIIGVCFAIFSIPLLLVESPLSVMLEGFRPTEIIFFEFFCIKRLYCTGNERKMPQLAAVIIGILLAVAGAFIPLWAVATGMGIFVFTALTFLSPEFCFFFTLLFLPYFSILPYSQVIMAIVSGLGVFSFVRKTLFGKRVIFFEQYDAVIAVFALSFLISGVFFGDAGSFLCSVLTVAMTFGYFLAGNIVTNRRLADCAVNAVVLSSVPALIISFVNFFIDLSLGEVLNFVFKGIPSSFTTPGAAAAFFITAIFFSAILSKETHGFTKFFYSVISVLNFLALVLTGEVFAVMAVVFGVLAYISLKSGGWLALWLPIFFLSPYLVVFIPERLLLFLPQRIYHEGTLWLIKRSLAAFADHILFGIGIGADNFKEVMSGYGVFGAESSGTLFLEIGLEAGLFALVAFVLLLIIRLIHRANYQRYTRHSQVSKLSPMVSVTVFALLVYGSFNYIFSDMAMVYLFFAVFGIAGASLRVAKQEHDDRVLYFEDEKSSTSSVFNIRIR